MNTGKESVKENKKTRKIDQQTNNKRVLLIYYIYTLTDFG